MNNNDNEPSIPALIVIPTRLDAGFFNALCAQPNNSMPLAQTTPASSKPVQPERGLLEQVAKTNPPSKSAGRSGLATDSQIKFMKSIVKKKGLREADICKEFDVKSFSDLTNQQASDFIEEHNIPDPW